MKNNTKTRLRAYTSHCIRGAKGNKATPEDMIKNCKAASDYVEALRGYILDWHRMDGFPLLDLYVPGEHDEFVQIAYQKKYLTEKQILDVDCEILDNCDILIVLGTYISRGMEIEIRHAKEKGMPILYLKAKNKNLSSSEKMAILALLDFVSDTEND